MLNVAKSNTHASNDWIRAVRLLKAGKLEEFKKMDDTSMWRKFMYDE